MRQLFVLIALLLLCLPGWAQSLRIDQAGISVAVPTGWDTQDDGQGLFTLTSPSEHASAVFEAVQAEDDEILEQALTDYLLEFVEEAYYTEPWIERRVNGIFYIEAVGVAAVADVPVNFRLGYFRATAEVGVIVLTAVEQGYQDVYDETIDALLQSAAPFVGPR